MRVKEIAPMLGMEPKEAIQEIESLREVLTSQGHKVAKKLTAASALSEDAVKIVVAAVDSRKKAAREEQEQKARAAQREEEERKRREEEERRQQELEARKKAIEEARKKADEELEKRKKQLAAITGSTEAPPPPVAPPPIQQPPPGVPPQARAGVPAPPPPPAPTPNQQRQGPPPPAPPRPTSGAARPAAPPPGSRQAPHPSGPPRGGERRDAPPRPDQPRARQGGAPGKELGESATAKQLESFITRGIGPTVTDDYKARRREDGGKKERPRTETDAERARRRKTAPAGGRERKHFRPTQIYEGEVISRPRPARPDRPRGKSKGPAQRRQARRQEGPPKSVELHGDFTVGQFAERLRVPASEIIRKLMGMGEMLNVNQVLDPEMAELIAAEFGVEIAIQREGDEYDVEKYVSFDNPAESLRPRPPVVTVMGHVDHGKTSLLDHIRKSDVVDKESGGITQHIGAYFVQTDKGDIVFLDTPGHEAFTAMRARGATVTDLVVLVVAANDGVKPQTVEAINHAKAANVPIVVAINKIDVEGANPDRVKTELMRFELVSEDLGGETLMVPISALKGTNVDTLLENIALQAEVLELTANPDRPALGAVVESHLDPNRGAVATVLVQEGTLRQGDIFVCGTEFGRIRAMRDDHGRMLQEAGPATPVEIMGLSGAPGAGEQFVVMPDEAAARDIAERRQARRKMRTAAAAPHVTLENLADQMKEGETKTLNLIIKGDVQGSVEAIAASLMKIKSDKILLRLLHTGVGTVGEADVQLADASDAIILGFNVRPDPASRQLAEKLGVEIRTYSIIYQLLEEVESAMVGMLEPVYEEQPMGRAEVRDTFKVTKVGTIAGCFIAEGNVGRDHKARLLRGGTVVWKGDIASLRRHKDDVKEVVSGLECGIGLTNFNDVKVGDEIETFVLKEKAASLVSEPQTAGSSSSSDD